MHPALPLETGVTQGDVSRIHASPTAVLLQGSRHFSDGHDTTSTELKTFPRRPRCQLYRAQGTSLPATIAPSYTPLYSWLSPYVYKRGCPGPREREEEERGKRGTNIRAYEYTHTRQERLVDARQRDGRRRAGAGPPPLSLSPTRSLSLSRPRSLATLVTPTTSTLVQDNTRLIPHLCSERELGLHLVPN